MIPGVKTPPQLVQMVSETQSERDPEGAPVEEERIRFDCEKQEQKIYVLELSLGFNVRWEQRYGKGRRRRGAHTSPARISKRFFKSYTGYHERR